MSNVLIGIDVSNAQGTIDWDTVAASNVAQYVFCKATEGLTYVDSRFQTNWAAIKSHGWVRGCYHFARVDADAVTQADHFVSTVGSVDPSDMLVLDIETASVSGSQFTDWNLAWLQRVEQQTGCTPIVYTGGPFFNSHGGSADADTAAKLAHYPLWLAAYTNSPNNFIPAEWKHLGWTFWQSSGDVAASGHTVLHVPGIHGNVDCDQFLGTLEDLKTFALNLHPSQNNVFTGDTSAVNSGS